MLDTIICGDCLEVMPTIEDKSVDMILADLPYGVTACKWDTPLPLDELWAQFERITKPNAAVVFMATQPFTSQLICSKQKSFCYCLVWEKTLATGFLNAKIMPLRTHEDVVVFYTRNSINNFTSLRDYFKWFQSELGMTLKEITNKLGRRAEHCFYWGSTQWGPPTRKTYTDLCNLLSSRDIKVREYDDLRREYEKQLPTYNPQGTISGNFKYGRFRKDPHAVYGDLLKTWKYKDAKVGNYPKSVIKIPNPVKKGHLHGTQKPVALFEYLIRTYTNERDTVLDPTAGSGTTAVACHKSNRHYICIEKEPEYCAIAEKRITEML